MNESIPDTGRPVRPMTLVGVAATGLFASAVLGAATNTINGWVSPQYFITVMRWQHVADVWRASIAQGIFEGLLFGVFFSLVFTAGVGIITRCSCKYDFAFRHLFGVIVGAFACWGIGGLTAIGLASLSPEFYQRTFRGVPHEFGPMLAYAWVGGSIWGIEFGGLISVVLGLVVLRGNWLRASASFQRP